MASSASTRPDPDQRPVPSPSNPVLLAVQAQWLFTDEELTRTPSQLDGMKMEAEHMSRSKGVNFITQVGIMLKLPQLTLATAAVYMHRFFMRFSMVDLPQRPGLHPYPIAATSLFLATKVEENVRRMREIVVSCCRVALKQPNMIVDEQSKEFWKWRDTILHHEDILLEALCFDLHLEQPYRILYDFICFFGVGEHKPLRNAAWAFVNDSMYTVLCLQFNSRTIAAAALYAAARHCDVGFKDDDLGRPWWEQLDVGLLQVRRACMRMAQLYENNAMQKHSQYYPTTPITTSSDEGTEKTRIPRAGVSSSSRLMAENSSNTPNRETADGNGRKRSREPEADARERSESANPRDQGTASLNGERERSPKRQRTAEAESRPPGGQDTRPPSMTAPQGTTTELASRDRHANGHLPPSHHPQPPHSSEKGQLDPVQQRIDNIVQQNLPQDQDSDNKYRRSVPGDTPSRRGRDRSRDWDPDRDRDRDQPQEKRPSRPPPPPPEPEPELEPKSGEKEEGEVDKSEEGEL